MLGAMRLIPRTAIVLEIAGLILGWYLLTLGAPRIREISGAASVVAVQLIQHADTD